MYQATLAEMDNLVELLASAEALARKYGAVRIDPPPEWTPPPLRMRRDSRFFVRSQTLPEAPFVDLTPYDDEVAQVPERNTKRQKLDVDVDARADVDDVEEVQPVQKRVKASHGKGRRRRVVNYAEEDDSDDDNVQVVINVDDNVIELDDSDDDPNPPDHDEPDIVIVQPTPPAQPSAKAVPPADKEPPRTETRLRPPTESKPPAPRESRPPPAPTETPSPALPTGTRPPPPRQDRQPAPTQIASKPAPPVPCSQPLSISPPPATTPKRPMLRSVLPTPPPAPAAVKASASPILPTAVESLPPVPRSKLQQTGPMPMPTAGFQFIRLQPRVQERQKGVVGVADGKQHPGARTPGMTQAGAPALISTTPVVGTPQRLAGAALLASSSLAGSSAKPQEEGANRDIAMVPVEAALPGRMSQPTQMPQTEAAALPQGKAGSTSRTNPLTSTVTLSPPLPTAPALQPQAPAAMELVTPVASRPSGFKGWDARLPTAQQIQYAKSVFALAQGARQPQDAAPHVNAVSSQVHANGLGPAPMQTLPTRIEQNVRPTPQVACAPVPQPSARVTHQHVIAPELRVRAAPTPAEPSVRNQTDAFTLPFTAQQLTVLEAMHGMVLGQRPVVSSGIAGQKAQSPTGLQSACLPVRAPVQQLHAGPALYSSAASHSQLPHAPGHAVLPTREGPAQQQQLPASFVGSGGLLGVCQGGAVGSVEAANDVNASTTCNRGSLNAILNHDPPTAVSRGEGEPSLQQENTSQVLHRPEAVGNPDDSRPALQAQRIAMKVDAGTREADTQPPVCVEHTASNGDAAATDVQPKASGPAQAQADAKLLSQLSVEEMNAFARASTQHATEQIQKLEDLNKTSIVPGQASVSGGEPAVEGNVPVAEGCQVLAQPQSSGVISGQAGAQVSHSGLNAQSTSERVLPSKDLQQGTEVSGEMGTQPVVHAAVETTATQLAQDATEVTAGRVRCPEAGEASKDRADAQGSDVLLQSTATKSQCVVLNEGILPAQEVQSVSVSKTVPTSTTGAALGTDRPKPDTVDQKQPALVEQASDALDRVQAQDTRCRRKAAEPTVKRPRAVKRPNRRNRSHVSNMKWDQDALGRLTEAPSFQDSPTPVSLDAYEKKAIAFSERMRKALLQDSRVNADVLGIIADNGDDDWLRNPDVLEGLFWEILHKGVSGKAITVNYGVDVEAEGAYKGQSYVEWYGMDKTGRMVKQEQKLMHPKPDKTTSKADVEEGHGTMFAGEMEGRSIGPATLSAGADLPEAGDFTGVASEGRTDQDGRREAAKKKKRKKPARKPEPPSPKCHVGNLNRSGLLRHVPRMPGVNHSMFYIGTLFTRFCWHTEDAFLNSVSYLHHGSADKIWYAVPPNFAPAFEDYAAKQVFANKIAKDAASAQMALMTKTTIFDPRELRRSGIQVYRIRHKPGSFVLTAPRAYHAGFNCGFNIAEAVNFANPSWFPVGREASGFARRGAYTLIVPYEYLLFHEAKALRDAFPTARRPQEATPRVVSNARILAGELDALVQEGERRIREYAAASNCRIVMLSEVDSLVKNNQLGPEFGPGAGMVCTMCKHACHFYAEICGSCPDNREARCVAHFGQGFRSGGRLCRIAGHRPVLVRRHDPVLLADILTRLEEVAGITSGPERILSRYRGFLRPWETPLKSSGLRLKLNLRLAACRAPPAVQKHKRKNSRNSRRSEPLHQNDLDDDPDFVQKKKRRRSDTARRSVGPKKKETSRKANRGRKVESPLPALGDFEVQVEVATQSELVQPGDPTVGSHRPTALPFQHSSKADDYFLEVTK